MLMKAHCVASGQPSVWALGNGTAHPSTTKNGATLCAQCLEQLRINEF